MTNSVKTVTYKGVKFLSSNIWRCIWPVLLLIPSLSLAEIYKQVLPDGSVIFSDQPAPGAEQIEISPAQTYRAPPIPVSSPSRKPANSEKHDVNHYDEIKIVTPEDDATIRENAGTVNITVSLSPALKVGEGHGIVLLMDGEAVQKPAQTTKFTLINVDRGTHQLQAALLDAQGKTILTSSPVIFHLFRVHRPVPVPATRN